jgi:hypothetical protein
MKQPFQLSGAVEVETPHGRGVVIYIDPQDSFANDIWCVANKANGQIRHYQTIQLKLSETGVLGVNEKK